MEVNKKVEEMNSSIDFDEEEKFLKYEMML